jgi:hypothetical protein
MHQSVENRGYTLQGQSNQDAGKRTALPCIMMVSGNTGKWQSIEAFSADVWNFAKDVFRCICHPRDELKRQAANIMQTSSPQGHQR